MLAVGFSCKYASANPAITQRSMEFFFTELFFYGLRNTKVSIKLTILAAAKNRVPKSTPSKQLPSQRHIGECATIVPPINK